MNPNEKKKKHCILARKKVKNTRLEKKLALGQKFLETKR